MAPHFTLSDIPVDQPDVASEKQALRRRARRLRRDCGDQGSALAAAILDHVGKWRPAIIAGYWPMGSEIDPRPALRGLAARGARIALPVVAGAALRFALWTDGDRLVDGAHGTRHPVGATVVPDLILVPLLAYDCSGRRLGQGGGYYDRTLAALPHAVAIGCAYAVQEVDRVPAAPHDRRLHAIATERGVIVCRPAPRE